MKNVILYERFSSLGQKKGDSLVRQSRLCDEWCKKNNGKLINAYVDEGVSGFKGKHAAVGALSKILSAIENGYIERDTYLLIENLDRLSREEISTALDRFSSILRAGINIVTLMDGKVFTPESANNLPDLMWALMTMARANEESATKSKRASSVWLSKRKFVEGGGKPKFKTPNWLDYDEKKQEYKLNKHAASVALIFELYLKGKSINRVAMDLNELKTPPIGYSKKWSHSTVRWILDSKQTYGVLDAKTMYQDDFYPAAISKETFYKAQSELNRRKNKTGRTRNDKTPNLLTGLACCGVCGESITMQGKNHSSTGKAGNFKYLMCSTKRYSHVESHCGLPNFRYKYVEMILAVILSSIDTLPKSRDDKDNIVRIKTEIESIGEELEDIEKQIDNLIEALAVSKSDRIAAKLAQLEQNEAELKRNREALEVQYNEITLIEDDEKFEQRIRKLSVNIQNDEYRRELLSVLYKVIDEWRFNADGSISVQVSGNKINVSGVKGNVEISFPDRKIMIQTK
ncbi:hypothetical protein VME_45900 [Vibrio harveyi 1DA3]|nr:hypothetical protein VME_45900 [Vibrio harveyi 1DA3]